MTILPIISMSAFILIKTSHLGIQYTNNKIIPKGPSNNIHAFERKKFVTKPAVIPLHSKFMNLQTHTGENK